MNKNILSNVWFIRIISLFFAIFLYIFVASESANVPIRVMKNQESASVNITETISNVPVYLGKTDGETFISGVPETVDVRLTGPRNIINQVTSETLRVETEDLTNMQAGSRAIRYKVMNLPDKVDYQITPSRTIVQISRKETVTLPIEYDINPSAINNDFEVTEVILNPSEVTLTGNDEIIKKIDRVFINITSEQKNKTTFSGTYAIKIVDKEGNLLDVNASATNIKAEVKLTKKSQKVSVNIYSIGEDTKNYTYTYEITAGNTVKVISDTAISNLSGAVNVKDMNASGTVPVTLEIPKNATLVGNPKVEVYVNIVKKNNVGNSTAESPVTTNENTSIEESTKNN